MPPRVETEPFAAVVIEGKSKGRVMSLREAVGQAIVCELDAVIITWVSCSSWLGLHWDDFR